MAQERPKLVSFATACNGTLSLSSPSVSASIQLLTRIAQFNSSPLGYTDDMLHITAALSIYIFVIYLSLMLHMS